MAPLHFRVSPSPFLLHPTARRDGHLAPSPHTTTPSPPRSPSHGVRESAQPAASGPLGGCGKRVGAASSTRVAPIAP
ncbi:hypothetical protein E2C01_093317 [Portunus trituberculatus]|uniref:Uncharacterized protein n=1 Tax=Portunus trituberculatus TaxID=210409 RepID=A0A5B7JMF1_PORTR|nr:hypothetical protein [Portunus trituberculatus]